MPSIAATSDDDAARRLYRKYRMELFRFGFHVLHDEGLAEEMVQETFIKFCRQARNYDASRGPVRAWLFTMARSTAYDIARRPSSRPLLPVEDFQLPPQYNSVDQALTVLTVDQALDKLPSIYADVMRLVRDGFTHSEIAERLGIPIGTVKSRMAKAADTLRSELASLRRAATMLSERDIELAHPEAFDFVFGNLPRDKRAEFNRHLAGCRYCQGVVDEYSEIGRIIKTFRRTSSRQPTSKTGPSPPWSLPWPSKGLSQLDELTPKAPRRTKPPPGSTRFPRFITQPSPTTRVQPRPQLQPPAEDEPRVHSSPASPPAPAEPQARPMVTRLPVWRRHRGRLAAVVAAAAAAITGAIAIPLSLLGSGPATVIPLYATTAAKVSGVGAATGQATARQDASGSWNISLTVRHLKNFEDAKWYECWYIGSKSGQRQVAPVGSFLVSDSSSQTFTMTSAVDPHDFKTMVITLQLPSADGAFQQSNVILSGQTL